MRILLDNDGVLFDFIGAVHQLSADLNLPIRWPTTTEGLFEHEDGLTLMDAVRARQFGAQVHAYPGAQRFVSGLRRAFPECELIAITAPFPAPEWCRDRQRKNEDLEIHQTVFCGPETKQYFRGDWLIEDKISTVLQWCEANPEGRAIYLQRGYDAGPPEAAHKMLQLTVQKRLFVVHAPMAWTMTEVYPVLIGIMFAMQYPGHKGLHLEP